MVGNSQLPSQAYEMMEARDEEQILAEIKGNIITEMFYSFKIGGKEVTGVSWVGTKEIARRYGSVRMDFVELLDLGDDWMAVVRATDTRSDTGMLGTSLQAKTMEVHDVDAAGKWLKASDGSWVTHREPDRFASTKAISKAQRNAIRAIIPEKYLLEMYLLFKKGCKPEARKVVDAEAKPVEEEPAQPGPPPSPTDEEMRVAAVLETNNLPTGHVLLEQLKGGAVRVTAGPSFPRDMFTAYDRVLKTLGATWSALENCWTVGQGGVRRA